MMTLYTVKESEYEMDFKKTSVRCTVVLYWYVLFTEHLGITVRYAALLGMILL